MIPDIGIMIGFYIVSRMLELISSSDKMLIKLMAVVTILVSVIGLLDLFLRGAAKT